MTKTITTNKGETLTLTKLRKTYYKTAYDGTASITEHRDGTATLVVAVGMVREKVRCKSVTSAKRALSRRCDGFYREVTCE